MSKKDLLLCLKTEPPLVEGMVDPALQVGENGIDLSVRKIERFTGSGMVGFGEDAKTVSPTEEIEFASSVHLAPGTYKITYNEWLNIPKNLIAIARPRTSLLRNGVAVEAGVWDAGYSGRGISILTVYNPAGLELQKNARVTQLVFLHLTQPVDIGYVGKYQNENRSG